MWYVKIPIIPGVLNPPTKQHAAYALVEVKKKDTIKEINRAMVSSFVIVFYLNFK